MKNKITAHRKAYNQAYAQAKQELGAEASFFDIAERVDTLLVEFYGEAMSSQILETLFEQEVA